MIRKAVKIAANISFKGVKDKVVNTAKRYIKNKIDGYYQIGKAYVESKINEISFKATMAKELYNSVDIEVGISDPAKSCAYSKGPSTTIGFYNNSTYKFNEGKLSTSANQTIALGPVSYSPAQYDGDKNVYSISIDKMEISNIGIFFGKSYGVHYGGFGGDIKIGIYIPWAIEVY